ncbi:lipopolysaccharide assembly protein LapB [Ruminococcus flavefaciens]|uniref:tetratricopeptide repeat protein n=1 Tax=Ruminococcus flavefaciens TaxID=1265 RepID=UPI0026EEA7ED|nr:hypothetical protein [Ruminococcus flavefaciens]
MFRSILAARAKRVLLCFWRSIPKALAASFVFSLFIFAALVFLGDREATYPFVIMYMAVIFLFHWLCISFVEIIRFKKSIFHQFDDELIGNAFTGINRKSRRFEKGLNLFHKNNFRMALEAFTDLGREENDLSKEETAVNEFYRGRCYDILDAYPNAIICYKNAQENGFYIPELPIFIARCYSINGDPKRAMAIYESLMEEDGYKYSNKLRCEMGNVYLKEYDGESALKWFSDSIERREDYANALGGAAIANVLLGHYDEAEKLYKLAIVHNIDNPVDFMKYYKGTVALQKDQFIRKL